MFEELVQVCWRRLSRKLQRRILYLLGFAAIEIPAVATILSGDWERRYYIPLVVGVTLSIIVTQVMALRQYRRIFELLNPMEANVSVKRKEAASLLLNKLFDNSPVGMKKFSYRVYMFDEAVEEFYPIFLDQNVDQSVERTPWRKDTGVIGEAFRKVKQVEEEGEQAWNGRGIPAEWHDRLKKTQFVVATPCENARGRAVGVVVASVGKGYKRAAENNHQDKLKILREMSDAAARIIIDILGEDSD